MIEDATSPRHFEWARHRSRGELLDLVLEVEDRMRRLVRAVLRDAASDEAPAAWEPLIGDSLHAQIALTPARPAHADLLDRATLKQLFMIVLHRSDLFCDLFGERSRFHDEADRFLGRRNQLAHVHHLQRKRVCGSRAPSPTASSRCRQVAATVLTTPSGSHPCVASGHGSPGWSGQRLRTSSNASRPVCVIGWRDVADYLCSGCRGNSG